MIDPNIWHSEDFSKLSNLAKLVFIGMFSNADDEGRGRAKPAYLKSIIFPYDENMRVSDVDKALDEIASNMSVTFYTYNGNEYYSLDNWSKWQRVDKPQPSTIPIFDEHSKIIRRTFDEHSTNNLRTIPPNRKEENIREENRKEESIREEMSGVENTPLPACKKTKHKYGEYQHVLLTDDEYKKLKEQYGNVDELIKCLDEYIEMKGYKAKNHYLAIKKWVVDAVKEKQQKKTQADKPTTKFSDYKQEKNRYDFEAIEKLMQKKVASS